MAKVNKIGPDLEGIYVEDVTEKLKPYLYPYTPQQVKNSFYTNTAKPENNKLRDVNIKSHLLKILNNYYLVCDVSVVIKGSGEVGGYNDDSTMSYPFRLYYSSNNPVYDNADGRLISEVLGIPQEDMLFDNVTKKESSGMAGLVLPGSSCKYYEYIDDTYYKYEKSDGGGKTGYRNTCDMYIRLSKDSRPRLVHSIVVFPIKYADVWSLS